jgi:PPOX class probable F420-dependent enzyme
MPKPPVPREIDEFLAQPNPSVIATLQADGSPSTAATWYVWENGRILVNLDEGRRRLEHMRRDPRVSLTVLGKDDWYHQVSLRGRVVSIDEDADFSDIDRISRHYTGEQYAQRDRGRVSAWIEVERWHAWAIIEPWTPSD